MSDESPTPNERSAPEPEAGQQPQQPPLLINGQYVKDLSFEAPNTPQVFSAMQGEAPKIQVDIDVQADQKQQNIFEVVLKVRAEARAQEKELLAYLLEVEYAGIFTLNVPPEHLGPIVLIECPMILFPFLRRIVADITGDGGFAPLLLSPIDFSQLYQQRVQAAQAAQAQQAQA